MNIEQLDGFFAALLAGPPVLKPCQYWPVVLGKEVGDPSTLDYIRKTTELLPFFARHWHSIAQTLDRGGVHMPYLSIDGQGVAVGRDWARGFLQAVELRVECWHPLISHQDYAAALVPMMILAHEHDPNPLLRSPKISEGERDEIIKQMVAGLIRAHRYFSQCKSHPTVSTAANLH